MPGLNSHPIMNGTAAREDAGDIVERTLALLENRRGMVDAKSPSDVDVSRNRLFQNEVRRTLQGSILPADQRRTLMTLAEELGLRPFEATLMIAMAQDRARHEAPGFRRWHPIKSDREKKSIEERPSRWPSAVHLSTAVCTGVLLGSALILLLNA